MRDDGWDSLLDKVASLYIKLEIILLEIIVPNMNKKFVARGRPHCIAEETTNSHHFSVELFYTTIDYNFKSWIIVSRNWMLICFSV